MILEGKADPDVTTDDWLANYFLEPSGKEYFLAFLGELYIMRGKAQHGIKCMVGSMKVAPLLFPCETLYFENIKVGGLPHSPISKYFSLISEFNPENYTNLKSTRISNHPLVISSSRNIPGTGSYAVSKIAGFCARLGEEKEAAKLFKLLRRKDPFWIGELDVYSTMLWRMGDENTLGLLAKELIVSHPNHFVTWIVIANYYSLKNKSKEAIESLMRSIAICESAHAYTLLGFEFNSKNCFIEAQHNFRSSLCMLENNDRALFGLGLSYAETYKYEMAERYFKRAMAINPHFWQMKASLVRFYVKNKNWDAALSSIREYLCLGELNHDEIANYIENHSGEFSNLEELVICELSEVFYRKNYKLLAQRLINSITHRKTSAYCSKRALIENEE